MGNFTRLAGLSLVATCVLVTPVLAAEFQNGQAARAVIGQASFSARDTAITPMVLALSNGWLYAADGSHRLLTLKLSQIPGPKDEAGEATETACTLCGFSFGSIANQSVLPEIAGVSIHGKTIVAADAQNHRVLIWRDSSVPRAAKGPDISLGRNGSDSASASASTIIDPVSVAFDGKRLFVGDAALHRVLIWNSLPMADAQPADIVLGQQNFTLGNAPEAPGADSINRPAALASDGTNLFIADNLDHRILVFSAGDLPLSTTSVVNSASLMHTAAPGALVTIETTGVTSSSAPASDESLSLPTKLAGAEVFLNGMKLPLLSIAPSEIRAQLPYSLETPSSASLYVRMEREDGTVVVSNAVAVKLLPTAAGLFAFAGPEPRSGMVLHMAEDGSQPGTPVTVESPAKPGEILAIWTAGLGAVDDNDASEPVIAGQAFVGPDAAVIHTVTATVNGRAASVLSAQLPEGSIGIYQVRIALPSDLPDDPNTPLVVAQDGVPSNTVTIPVRNSIQ